MSVSKWAYTPEVCDGGGCPGDCDLCDKPKNMEDEPSDYISRQAAIKVVKIETNDAERLYNNIVEGLRYIPSADVVEVVRCKDCIYHNNKTEFCKQWSIFGTVKSDRNDFCSYGKRADK